MGTVIQRSAQVFLLFMLLMIMGGSGIALNDPYERARSYTRNLEFDFISWMGEALLMKWTQAALGGERILEPQRQVALVEEFMQLTGTVADLERQLSQQLADPSAQETDTPEIAALRSDLDAARTRMQHITPLVEAVLQAQASEVLNDHGLTLLGQPMPPVMYHSTAPPRALIVSPRHIIQQDANISIDPEITPDGIEELELTAASGLDASTLVVGIGGIGVYPTMVMRTTDLNWTAEVIAHEWIHNYLTFRPLGANYLTSGELRTINETLAGIAGRELGAAMVARYYPERVPAPPLKLRRKPVNAEEQQSLPAPSQGGFDFRAEMRKTRLAVDDMLAAGEIEKAELYMELRRSYFWENGYLIRKINQAYFAFYGAYADAPGGGAAGADPVGEAVRRYRSRSIDLATFINGLSWIWSTDQLYQLSPQPGEAAQPAP